MGRTKLTKSEIALLLITIKDELKILFEELELKQTIVADLSILIEKEFKVNLESKESINEIFNE